MGKCPRRAGGVLGLVGPGRGEAGLQRGQVEHRREERVGLGGGLAPSASPGLVGDGLLWARWTCRAKLEAGGLTGHVSDAADE